jgi:hypothetical protein
VVQGSRATNRLTECKGDHRERLANSPRCSNAGPARPR